MYIATFGIFLCLLVWLPPPLLVAPISKNNVMGLITPTGSNCTLEYDEINK